MGKNPHALRRVCVFACSRFLIVWEFDCNPHSKHRKKNPHDYAVCVYLTCSRFLIARLKILYLSALRDGKEGGRVEAATHTQNIERKTRMTTPCVCI